MTIEELFRAPQDIISDLLRIIEAPASLEPKDHDDIKDEARAYLEKVAANQKAWAGMADLHRTCIFDQTRVDWEPGL